MKITKLDKNMNNEYKSVCNKCYRKTWYETQQSCHVENCTGTLMVISNENLDPRLTRYYENRERVEVTGKDYKLRFWVGKSTGWKPCYLEILRRNSSGGAQAYLPKDATIRGLGIYR